MKVMFDIRAQGFECQFVKISLLKILELGEKNLLHKQRLERGERLNEGVKNSLLQDF
jgi:hypothetical protein